MLINTNTCESSKFELYYTLLSRAKHFQQLFILAAKVAAVNSSEKIRAK